MAESEHPVFVITEGTSVWRNRRFVRWWGLVNVAFSAILAWIIASGVPTLGSDILAGWINNGFNPWLVAAMTGVFYIAFYILIFLLFNTTCEERILTKHNRQRSVLGLGSPYPQNTDMPRCRHQIAEILLRPPLRRRRNLGTAVREYDALHAESGILEQRVSLLIEEGRWMEWERLKPTLDKLVGQAFIKPTPGEIEPVRLPVRLRYLGMLLPLFIVYIWIGSSSLWLLFDIITTGLTPTPYDAAPRRIVYKMIDLGAGLPLVSIVTYFGLREIGLFPLPLFRGECSAEKTRIFHRFRWKTFKPGRDLAILRFTSNREADIAFLGADGSHATARVGGKYLDHFIACWASPVKNAECRPGAEAEASGGHDEGRGGGER